MKKIFVYMASAALMFAVSCNKEEVNVDTTAPVETELITVDLNPMTKTALGVEGTTTWDADDKVSVTVGGEVVGTLSLVEGSTFSGEITAGLSGAAVLNYPAGVTTVPTTQTAVAGSFADEAALLEGTTTVEDLRAGTGVELKNKTALLMFTVAQAGDVTFEVGTAKYTVTGCKTGETYYACVTPASDVTFVARIGGYLSKQAPKNVTFTANKIAKLGNLPAPEDSDWRLRGDFDWNEGLTFYKDTQYYVVRNVSFDATAKFKVFNKTNNEWLRSAANVALPEQWYKIGKYDGGDSYVIGGTYDIYVDSKTYNVYFIPAEKELTASIPSTQTVKVYLNSTNYNSLWCWNKDKSSENFTGGTWPGISSTTNETINGKTYRVWTLKSSNIGVYLNMIFSKDGNSQTGEDSNTGLLMGETMFVKIEGGKTRFNNAI